MVAIQKLPAYCYAVLPSTGQLIRIDRDESGYCPIRSFGEHVYGEEAKQLRDELNIAGGVSESQRRAMEHGSMFGWDTPAADPDHPVNQRISSDERTINP